MFAFSTSFRRKHLKKIKNPIQIALTGGGNIFLASGGLRSNRAFWYPGQSSGGSKVPSYSALVKLSVFFLQYLFKFFDPANAALAEIDLDMAGELIVHHALHDFFQLVEFLEMFVFLFAHGLLFASQSILNDRHHNR